MAISNEERPAAYARNAARHRLSKLVALGSIGCILFIALGFLGDIAAPFDSLAHFRGYLSVGALLSGIVLLCAATRRRASLGALSVVAGLFGALSITPFMMDLAGWGRAPIGVSGFGGRAPAGTIDAVGSRVFTLLQMNVLYKAETEPGLDAIRKADADLVTIEELSEQWRSALSGIADLYPYGTFCETDFSAASVVVLSKFPFTGDVVCGGRMRFVAQTVDLPNGKSLTVGSQHLFWPWPYRQWRQIAALKPQLANLPKPLVIGGDFNAVPWSAAVRTYARMSGTTPVAGIGPTFAPNFLPSAWKSWIGLPIDNILVSDGVKVLSVENLAPTAADHLPVLMRFTVD